MRRALKSLTDNRLHENSGWSAYARSVADAIVGFNLSRYFSALNGVNLPVGRVQTATLGLVCARDEQVESLKKDAVLRRDGRYWTSTVRESTRSIRRRKMTQI